MKQLIHPIFAGLALMAAVSTNAACGGPTPVRGGEVEGLDDEAFSTGLDKRDLQKMLHENMTALQSSRVVSQWQSEGQPTLAVLPIRNETTDHVDSALDALMSEIEMTLINAGHVKVIKRDMQPELVDEVRRQYSDAFDQTKIAGWGKQIGVKYFITGKVLSADERHDGERRVQYIMFLEVVEVETGAALFSHKTTVTKALVD